LISFERIQAMAQQISEQFEPELIYLFGSYAYGQPTEDSDVDFLVVMDSQDATKPAYRMASKIRYALPKDCSIDIIVRDPADFAQRVKGFDGFLSTIAQQGALLYQRKAQAI
jgi:uncharacterized protein